MLSHLSFAGLATLSSSTTDATTNPPATPLAVESSVPAAKPTTPAAKPTTHAAKPTMPAAEPTGVKLYLEDLAIGDRWWSDAREISGDDVSDFAGLTGDADPLHQAGDADSPFGGPVAHGLLGLSVMAGLSSDHPRVATLALVEVSDWRFEAPIYFGDQVRVLTTVESISSHGRRAGRVVWHRQLFNQVDRVVQSGRIICLVARQTRLSARPNAPR